MSWRTIIVWGSSCALAGVALVALSAVGSGAGFVSPSIRLRVDQVIDQFVIDLEDRTPEETPPYSLIALADLDRDNIIDLVTVDTDEEELNLNFGTGSGLFEAPVTIEAVEPDDVTFDPIAVVPGDFTGPFDRNEGAPDGNIDLALVDDFGAVTIMIGDGEGNFATPDQILEDLDVFVTGAVAANFDGDSDLDLALAAEDQVAFVCNEGGTLRPCSETYVVVGDQNDAIIVDIAIGDFDNDGRPDVAALATDRSNRALVYPIFNEGDGNFALGLAIGVPGDDSELSSFAVADFNNDGFDDIVAVSDDVFGDNGEVSLGAANRSFQRTFFLETVPAFALAAGDFNEDSDPDILLSEDRGRLAYMAGDGTGEFGGSADLIFDRGVDNRFLVGAAVLKSADLNNDGLLDLVGLVRDGTQIEVALNVIGQPTQTPEISTPTPTATVEPSPTATVEPTTSATVEPTPVATTDPTRAPTIRPTIPSLDSDDDGCAVATARTASGAWYLVLGVAILLEARRRRAPS